MQLVDTNRADMSQENKRIVVVVGAGVIGLTTAIRLREAGYMVSILAQETPSTILNRDKSPLKGTAPGTYTSSGSGGLWMPFLLEGKEVETWSVTTYEELVKQEDQKVGVDVLEAFLLKANTSITTAELPWFASLSKMTIETHESDSRVPKQYACALRFSTPIVHMEPYLGYLQERAMLLGIAIELTVSYTPENKSPKWTGTEVGNFLKSKFGAEERVIVVNCCGIGASALADDEMIPVRGIVVRVKRPEERRYMISEDPTDGLLSKDGVISYAIPRGDEYTLGGTILRGDWRETVSEEDVKSLKERVDTLIPGIGDQPKIGVWAGLRPMRHGGAARVEIQEEGLAGDRGFQVIANYGHGGNGVTTCWGCADEVVEIAAGLEHV